MFTSTEVLTQVALLASVAFASAAPATGGGIIDDSEINFRSAEDVSDRVQGGKRATIGQLPHQISIRLWNGEYNFGHICGGSIITNRFVLTSAGCFLPELPNPENYRLVMGTNKNNDINGTMYYVKRLIIHEDFSSDDDNIEISNDIALIETAAEIKFNNLVAPIALHHGFIEEGAPAIVAGWGHTKKLDILDVQTLSNPDCRKQIFEKTNLTGVVRDFDTICAYSGKEMYGLCNGDFGAGLVHENKLIGIASWAWISMFDCAFGVPEGYTRISTFVEWINKNIQSPS